jgi:prevent-host-death family protein
MRFVTVRELKQRGKEIWKELRSGEEIVLTYNGSPLALLIGVQEDELEETIQLVRRARVEAAISRMRERARQAGLDRLGEEEIEAEIRAVRQERSP